VRFRSARVSRRSASRELSSSELSSLAEDVSFFVFGPVETVPSKVDIKSTDVAEEEEEEGEETSSSRSSPRRGSARVPRSEPSAVAAPFFFPRVGDAFFLRGGDESVARAIGCFIGSSSRSALDSNRSVTGATATPRFRVI
jgi:hypothetical protein